MGRNREARQSYFIYCVVLLAEPAHLMDGKDSIILERTSVNASK
jgi:hypothetical protein